MGACIYLGNLSPEQIEKMYEFSFTDDERNRLHELWHYAANFKDGEHGWHMFDMPEFLALSDGPIGREVLATFLAHSKEMRGSFPAGYACKEVAG